MDSLVGLRAELQKKKQQLQERAVYGGAQKLKLKIGDRKQPDTQVGVETRNKGVTERDEQDKLSQLEEQYSEDKARSVLEQKAALYDRLHGGIAVLEDDQLNNTFLVNFQKKIVNNVLQAKQKREDANSNSSKNKKSDSEVEDEWVEYVDAFGRTREVRRSEVAELEKQDQEFRIDHKPLESDLNDDEAVSRQQQDFAERFREQQRQRWEQQEEINAHKKDLYFSDVMFDEARVLGSGYVKLSTDEVKRKEQQKLLRELHESSKRAAAQHRHQQRSKEKGMARRLEKIRQRKRLKMGLPIAETKLQTPVSDEDSEVEEEPMSETTRAPNSEIPAKRPGAAPREWDVGKQVIAGMIEPADKDPDAFKIKNPLGGKVEMSQELWVEKKRLERDRNFAPPKTYTKNSSVYKAYKKECSSQECDEEIARQERYNRDSQMRDESNLNIINECESGPSIRAKQPMNSFKDYDSCEDAQSSSGYKRVGAAIPPPVTHEYYGPPDKYTKPDSLFSPIDKMEEAISKGLKKLREESK